MPERARSDRVATAGQPESAPVPSWIIGVCGVAAVASALFSFLLFLNR